MRWPLDKVFITQEWGNDLIIDGIHVYAKWGYKGHNGIDLRAITGTPVFAPHDGVVKERRSDADGYGNYLKIENDIEGSILAHLQEWKVNVNKHVQEGDLIALSNNTGASTAPHLHWGYYRFPRDKNNGYGGTIDPVKYLEEQPMPEKYDVKGVGEVVVPVSKDDLLRIDKFLQDERDRLVKAKEKIQFFESESKKLADINGKCQTEKEQLKADREGFLVELSERSGYTIETYQMAQTWIETLTRLEDFDDRTILNEAWKRITKAIWKRGDSDGS